MRRNYLLLLAASIAILGCKKEANITSEAKEKLQGKWEARHFIGDVDLDSIEANPLAGNGRILEFRQQKYKWFARGRVADSGAFKLIKRQKEVRGEDYELFLVITSVIDPALNWDSPIKLCNDKLQLAPDFDFSTWIYKKIG